MDKIQKLEEQIKVLQKQIEIEKINHYLDNNLYTREKGKKYYCLEHLVVECTDNYCAHNNLHYLSGGYFKNENEAIKLAKIFNLNLKMRKWVYLNDPEIRNLETGNFKYNIVFCEIEKSFKVDTCKNWIDANIVYFSSREKALYCIEVFKSELEAIYDK